MPLVSGSSRSAISANIAELTRSGKAKGKIGNVPTRSAAKASKVAQAIAFRKAREGKARKAGSMYRAKDAVKKSHKG